MRTSRLPQSPCGVAAGDRRRRPADSGPSAARCRESLGHWRKKLWELPAIKKIPHFRLGTAILLYPVDALKTWLEAQRKHPYPPQRHRPLAEGNRDDSARHQYHHFDRGSHDDVGVRLLRSSRRDFGKDAPAVPAWTMFQTRRPTIDEFRRLIGRKSDVDAVCLVAGKVSGNLELLRFRLPQKPSMREEPSGC